MILVVGLGNPGKKYELSRHNLGFQIVDEFGKKNNFSGFKLSKKFKVLISEGFLNKEKIILAKPQTFMNLSGKTVKRLIGNCPPASLSSARRAGKLPVRPSSALEALAGGEIGNLFVVHDDIDLPLGKIRIVKNRGAAGHKGVGSIIKELKTKAFVRFRIGIKPEPYTLTPKTLDRFVLQKFSNKEEKIKKDVIKKTCQAITITLKEGLEKAMARTN